MRVFGVDYQFLSCGDVFTKGLERGASELGLVYDHALWDALDLERRVTSFQPDLLFVVHGRRFCQRFPNFGFAKRSVWQRAAVWLLDEPYEVDDTSGYSNRFDHVFVNDPSTLARHVRASYLPVCYDPHRHHAMSGHELKTQQVGFIGGANSRRERLLGALARAGRLSYVVGGYWSDPDVNAKVLTYNCTPDVTALLYASTRLVVNVFREQHHFNRDGIPATAMNPRIYEALACGALVVSEWREEIARRVPSLPTFSSEEDCLELVQQLLTNYEKAEWIRARCVEELKRDTYANRLATVIETMQAVTV